MGASLVERNTRSVSLTADGQRLLVHARQIVVAADEMIRRFRTADIEGEVRFGSPEDFASAYLPEVLSAFAAVYDRVQLHVACDLTLKLIAQFERGEHDLVIIKQDPSTRHPGARVLWKEELVWVGAATAEPEAFAALCETLRAIGRPLPVVLAPAPCVYRTRATTALDQHHVPWTSVYESPSHAGMSAAVKAGLGYAVMPRALKPAGLIAFGPELGWPELPEAEMCLLPGAKLSPAAAALYRFIEERAPAHRDDPLVDRA